MLAGRAAPGVRSFFRSDVLQISCFTGDDEPNSSVPVHVGRSPARRADTENVLNSRGIAPTTLIPASAAHLPHRYSRKGGGTGREGMEEARAGSSRSIGGALTKVVRIRIRRARGTCSSGRFL